MTAKKFHVIIYDSDIKMVFRKTEWFTSKKAAKEYYADTYTKVLAVTDDIIEALELMDKYEKKYEEDKKQ